VKASGIYLTMDDKIKIVPAPRTPEREKRFESVLKQTLELYKTDLNRLAKDLEEFRKDD